MNDNKKRFGKVAVLYGGWSAERPVSLKSGAQVLQGLLAAGVDAHGIDAGRDIIDVLKAGQYDRVFNIMHGRGGEDGVIQGVLELLGIPYTGCGVMASAISMDKLITKRLWLGTGLPTPNYRVLTVNSDFEAVVAELGLPLMVKPVKEGSSIGMTKVKASNQLADAYYKAAEFCSVVIAEQWITGQEFTAGILANEPLPLIRVEVPGEFYTYDAKYISNETQYHCPCGLAPELETQLQQLALSAFQTVGGNGWGRVDMMLDNEQRPWLIEVNTNPGMTDHSLVPMAARQAGMSFSQLVVKVLETTLV